MMRRVLVCVVSVCALTMTTVGARAPRQQAPAEGQPPPAAASAEDETWKPESVKNLTILPKDMSPDDVMKVMRAWDQALNVQCVFCHVGVIGKPLSTYDFASDSKKRKETARVMLKASMATNEAFKTIGGDDTPEVQCSTCHKRSRHVDSDLPPEKPNEAPHD
jgi:hypothetical protein